MRDKFKTRTKPKPKLKNESTDYPVLAVFVPSKNQVL